MTSIKKYQEYLNRRISPNAKFEDLLSFPRYIEIETINACNARCPMCTIQDWERRDTKMDDKLFKKISEEIIENSDEVKRVTLYRDGEPLMDKKIADKIYTLKRGGIKETSISTNLGLLNEKKSKELLEAGLDVIIFSIDSLEKEIYEKIRVRLNFEEVMNNALKFIELRNKLRPETQIWFRMIRQESNKDEFPSYYEFWKEKASDNDRIYYHNIFNWGGQLKGYKAISKSYEPNLPCIALWSLLVIFCNGDVPICNVDFNNKYPTGNVRDSTIRELWNSKIMNQRRELHLNKQKSKISICPNCNVWDEAEDSKISISKDYAELTTIV